MKINGITISGGSNPGVLLSDQTILSGSWVISGSFYEHTFTNSNITVSSSVDVTPYNNSIVVVQSSGILPRIISLSGSCKIYAQTIPSTNINCDILITPIT